MSGLLTMRKGANIQLTNMLKQICFHIALCESSSCKDSYRTLHKIGYIITSRPTAVEKLVSATLHRNSDLRD